MNSNVSKQAQKDAYEYAAAYMSYGEGAGTRRKLIEGTVDYKMHTVPGYKEAFTRASEHQDMASHAKRAKTTNRRRDANAAVVRNTKALATGKYESANTGILLIGAVGYGLYKTGYDKKIVEYGKKKYKDLKRRYKKTNSDTVHNVTKI